MTAEKSETQKMLDGELYLASDPALVAASLRSAELLQRYNQTPSRDRLTQRAILQELFGAVGASHSDDRLFEISITKPDGSQHGPIRRTLYALCHNLASAVFRHLVRHLIRHGWLLGCEE